MGIVLDTTYNTPSVFGSVMDINIVITFLHDIFKVFSISIRFTTIL